MSGATGQPPRVSVVLAARDRRELLAQALESALAQEGPPLEVVVVDDGSGEETRSWLRARAAAEPRLRVVRQEPSGVGAARARGLVEAQGEVVVVLDSDDLLVPGAVARLDAALEGRPEVALFYGDVWELHADGRRVHRRYPAFASPRALLWATFLLPRVPFKHSGMAFRRAVALALGSYDPELPLKVDVDLFLRFLHRGEGVAHLAGEPTAVFRIHAGSISRDRQTGRAVWRALGERYGPALPPGRALLVGTRLLWERAKALAEAFWR
ncbi:MAG TPA: glycosyltransferase [Thermoanaerobaculia bacterium]|nr:glycosyltransferase [Thermoanaerobaculia bacterium]